MSENTEMSPEERFYEDTVRKILQGIGQGLSFEQAVSMVTITDAALKAAILDDTLKICIAEKHFSGGKSTEDVASALGLPHDMILAARSEMLSAVEEAAIAKYKSEQGPTGNA